MKASYLLLFLFFLTSYVIVPSQTYAKATCDPVYGGGQHCTRGKLVLESDIYNPQDMVFTSTLTNWSFNSNDTLHFKTILSNVGDERVDNITFKNILPPFTTFKSGQGTLNSSKTELTFPVITLAPHEEVSYEFYTTVVPTNKLTFTNTPNCDIYTTSQAVSKSFTEEKKVQFCIQKQITITKSGVPIYNTAGKMTKTPPTGPEVLPLLSLIPGALIGLYLRKKA